MSLLPLRTLCSRRDWLPCYNCWSLTCLPSSPPGAEGLPRLTFQVDISNQHVEEGWHGSSQVSWFLKEWKPLGPFSRIHPQTICCPHLCPNHHHLSWTQTPAPTRCHCFPSYLFRSHLHTIAKELLEKVIPLPYLHHPVVFHDRWAKNQTPYCGLQGLTHPSPHLCLWSYVTLFPSSLTVSTLDFFS